MGEQQPVLIFMEGAAAQLEDEGNWNGALYCIVKGTITPRRTKTRWDYYGDNMGLNQIF
jgi:hypothetical protein